MTSFRNLFKVLHRMGLCGGDKIAKIAKELHPDAVAVVPLYRSCMVVIQSKEDREKGIARLIFYADPAWLGYKRTKDTLRKKIFHEEVVVLGSRSSPYLVIERGDTIMELPIIGAFELLRDVIEEDKEAYLFNKVVGEDG